MPAIHAPQAQARNFGWEGVGSAAQFQDVGEDHWWEVMRHEGSRHGLWAYQARHRLYSATILACTVTALAVFLALALCIPPTRQWVLKARRLITTFTVLLHTALIFKSFVGHYWVCGEAVGVSSPLTYADSRHALEANITVSVGLAGVGMRLFGHVSCTAAAPTAAALLTEQYRAGEAGACWNDSAECEGGRSTTLSSHASTLRLSGDGRGADLCWPDLPDLDFGVFIHMGELEELKDANVQALQKGYPLPLLTVTEYFCDPSFGPGTSILPGRDAVSPGRYFRHAGLFTQLILGFGIVTWVLSVILLSFDLKHAIRFIILSGAILLTSNALYDWLLRMDAMPPLRFQGMGGEPLFLHLHYDWGFWTNLVVGVDLVALGLGLGLYDGCRPGRLLLLLGLHHCRPAAAPLVRVPPSRPGAVSPTAAGGDGLEGDGRDASGGRARVRTGGDCSGPGGGDDGSGHASGDGEGSVSAGGSVSLVGEDGDVATDAGGTVHNQNGGDDIQSTGSVGALALRLISVDAASLRAASEAAISSAASTSEQGMKEIQRVLSSAMAVDDKQLQDGRGSGRGIEVLVPALGYVLPVIETTAGGENDSASNIADENKLLSNNSRPASARSHMTLESSVSLGCCSRRTETTCSTSSGVSKHIQTEAQIEVPPREACAALGRLRPERPDTGVGASVAAEMVSYTRLVTENSSFASDASGHANLGADFGRDEPDVFLSSAADSTSQLVRQRFH